MNETDKSRILMSEHQSLYSLYQVRLNAVERRLPIAAVIITVLFGTLVAIPQDIKALYLFGIPIALIYLMKTTKTHAQSFEDLLRRIEEIEKKVNELAGEQLLNFQSKHPSREITVGGRFGLQSVNSVLILSLLVLGACSYIFYTLDYSDYLKIIYFILMGLNALYLITEVVQLRKYKYIKSSPEIKS